MKHQSPYAVTSRRTDMHLGVLVVIVALIVLLPAPALPTCQNEDGNSDGQPCLWTDPGTGSGYYVGSEDYR